jgi:hypothetical protein
MAFTCSALADMPAPPRAEPAERPLLLSYAPADDAPPDDFIVSDDLVSEDFIVSDDFVASEDLVSLGLAEGELVPLAAPLPLTAPPVEPVAPEDFVASDFVASDFVASDFVASEDLVSLGLAEGEVVPLAAPLADGDVSVFVSLAEGELPLLSPLVVPAAAPDDDEPVDPLGPCASAGAATNAKATASANAPVNVFIALPPTAVC